MSNLLRRAKDILEDIQTSQVHWEYCVVSSDDEAQGFIDKHQSLHNPDQTNLVMIRVYDTLSEAT